MTELYKQLDDEFKEDTNIFFDKDSVEIRKKLQYFESLIDKLNYQLFIANKKYKEVFIEYRKRVGLPVKEENNGKA